MRLGVVLLFVLIGQAVVAQQGGINGAVTDEASRSLEKATLRLRSLTDSTLQRSTASATDGHFSFAALPFGFYQLQVSYIGLQPLLIDSLHLHSERFLIHLGNVSLQPKTAADLNAVIIYAEKPLIQSKDGNITFNAAESALSQGSNASDLLTQVPLVTKDPDGKVLVRGKEPRILIDDKPVELNLQQLQDLLESLPGSAIEKIEVMTNPPPQYANEQGGVINIVTRKGTVGINGRLSLFAGSRGETGMNASFNYRRNGLSLNLNAGLTGNDFQGAGSSTRQNFYADSANHFKTENHYQNHSARPNLRANVDYALGKTHALNLVFQFNGNQWDNSSVTGFQNINRFGELYRLSNRQNGSGGNSVNPNINLNYTLKTRRAGEALRLFTGYWLSVNRSDRFFYQQFLNTDRTFGGADSTQQQLNNTRSEGYHLRLAYDRPLGKKTFLSAGGVYTRTFSDVDVAALYRRKTDGAFLPLDLLSNWFLFNQDVTNVRLSVKQTLSSTFHLTAGLATERTAIYFDLLKAGKDTGNAYWTPLPFFNLSKNWNNQYSLTASYRKSIRRPGINELNPTRDFSDPYNIRAGNPDLLPSTAHNLDLVLGRNKNALYTNLGIGYNIVNDIFNPIRTLQADGTTETLWQNISGKKEVEISTWSGYTFARKLRANLSASYVFNTYSDYDKRVRRYRDAGSFTSNLNANYTWKELYTATGNFTYNRFANPQGVARSTMSMNLGLQARVWSKKLTLTLNMIDPFFQQQNRNRTDGPNFVVESLSTTQTRNYRLSVGYAFSRTKTKRAAATEKAVQQLKPKS